MERKMFCFDLDNTLLNHKKYKISERILHALERLKQQGHIVVLASGRDFDTPNSKPFADMINPQAIVHANGLKVTANTELLFEHYFDKQLMKKVLDYGTHNNLCVGASIEGGEYYTHYEIIREFEINMYGYCHKTYHESYELLNRQVHSLHIVADKEEILELVREIQGLHYFLFNGNFGADLMDVVWSKAEGIQVLHDYYGMTWEDTICFGDSMNDLSMIQKAKRGFAVENGTQILKDAADMIIKSVDEDGVALAIETFFL